MFVVDNLRTFCSYLLYFHIICHKLDAVWFSQRDHLRIHYQFQKWRCKTLVSVIVKYAIADVHMSGCRRSKPGVPKWMHYWFTAAWVERDGAKYCSASCTCQHDKQLHLSDHSEDWGVPLWSWTSGVSAKPPRTGNYAARHSWVTLSRSPETCRWLISSLMASIPGRGPP